MGEVESLRKSRAKGRAPQSAHAEGPAQSPLAAPPVPAWLSAPSAAPFAIGGVQRKVKIGQPNDAYEREADQVASRVSGGGRVAPGAISSIAPAAPAPPLRRAVKPEDREKDPHTASKHLQRQSKPEDKKKEEKPAPVQRQSKAEKKQNEKPAAPPVQRQSKPEDKKKKAKPASVQRQSKPEKKKDEKAAAPAVQRQSKPEDKKKEAKPASVQRQSKPPEERKNEKPAAAPVQRQSKPDEMKKEEKPAPVQRQSKPEKKKDEKPAATPVQRQSKPDEMKKKEKPPAPEPVQRKLRPEDRKKEEVPGTLPVQRAEAAEKKPEHDAPVQASRSGAGGSAASMESAASHAVATKGPGEPLSAGTRGALESRMGTDLSDVRVHSDSGAHSAADALNARAFTHQSDIWLGRGESQHNLGLMAHEATHVVQQTGSIHRQLVQRATPKATKDAPATPDAPPAGDWDFEDKKKGKVKKGSRMVLPVINVPDFKKKLTPPSLTLRKSGVPRPTDQRDIWAKDIKQGKGLGNELDRKIAAEKATPMADGGSPAYFLKLKRRNIFIIGGKTALVERLALPYWNSDGVPTDFQVDHKREWQLNGENDISNLWLLEAKANMSSGSNIDRQINTRVETLLGAASDIWAKKPPDVETVRRSYTIDVEKVEGGLDVKGDPNSNWSKKQIKNDGAQLAPLKALNKDEIDAAGLQGTPSEIVIFTNAAGGGVRRSKGWTKKMTSKAADFDFGKLFQVTKVNFDHNTRKGSIEGDVYKDNKLIKEVKLGKIPLEPLPGIEYGGYISKAGLTLKIQTELKKLSPIRFEDLELTESGLRGRGKVLPTIAPFDKLDIDLVVDGDNIYLSRTFSADDLRFPGPVKVTSASIEVFAGTNGVGVRGDALFEIASVGKGKISGKGSTSEGPSLHGEFEFDPALFEPPAKFEIDYIGGKFSGKGQLSIKQGRIKGIKSASLTGSFADDIIDLKGSVKPDIPAVEEADFYVKYSKEAGLVIGGDLQIKKGIPGISGGSIHAEVTKKPGADRYIVKASGEAVPNIPGISAKLAVSYEDGLFDATATAGYAKGMLKGSITVGVTNRPVGDDGKPAGDASAKADKLTIYGGGSVTLKIAPWLQATAEIMLKPNGEVVVTGKIGLPSALEIFPEKKLEKNIFTIKIDIPIIGVSVLGHHIGVFVSIGGGLDLSAGIGPGQLTDLGLEVTYNPSNEEETHVSGGAKLHIPAHAGLRLFVRGSLGAGIPIVDAEAGIEVGGQLGLEGALDAGVQVDWTPQKGLVLDASAEIYAEPKFRFDITGFVKVEADLLFKTIELYSKRWELAAVEYGSGLRFGLKLPIHYEEGKPFNLSFSDVQFEYPDVNATDVLKGLIDKIV